MKKTRDILEALQVDKRLISLYQQKIKIPYVNDSYRSFTDKWYPHPPFLIPFFIDYSFPALMGVIYHPFSTRNTTIVTYDLEVKYMVEKARTANQFLTKMVLEMDMLCEGITEQIIKFCNDIEYASYEAVDQFAARKGDNPEYFRELVFFDEQTPLTYCKTIESYDGDYISSEHVLNKKMISSACSFEISNKDWLSDLENVPGWLTPTSDNKSLFTQYLQNGAMESAWFALNSEGWSTEERAWGLRKLTAQSDNAILKLISENWLSGLSNY